MLASHVQSLYTFIPHIFTRIHPVLYSVTHATCKHIHMHTNTGKSFPAFVARKLFGPPQTRCSWHRVSSYGCESPSAPDPCVFPQGCGSFDIDRRTCCDAPGLLCRATASFNLQVRIRDSYVVRSRGTLIHHYLYSAAWCWLECLQASLSSSHLSCYSCFFRDYSVIRNLSTPLFPSPLTLIPSLSPPPVLLFSSYLALSFPISSLLSYLPLSFPTPLSPSLSPVLPCNDGRGGRKKRDCV